MKAKTSREKRAERAHEDYLEALELRPANDPFREDDLLWYRSILSQRYGGGQHQEELLELAASESLRLDRRRRLQEFRVAEAKGLPAVPDPVGDQLHELLCRIRGGQPLSCEADQAERLACLLVEVTHMVVVECPAGRERVTPRKDRLVAPWPAGANPYEAMIAFLIGLDGPSGVNRQRWLNLLAVTLRNRQLYYPEWRKQLQLWDRHLSDMARINRTAAEELLEQMVASSRECLAEACRQLEANRSLGASR